MSTSPKKIYPSKEILVKMLNRKYNKTPSHTMEMAMLL
jgi:hypothetical protein